MKDCMNVAAGVFGVMVPVALLVCGWNVLAPAKWCWVERGIAAGGGAIATGGCFFLPAPTSASKKAAQMPLETRDPSPRCYGEYALPAGRTAMEGNG